MTRILDAVASLVLKCVSNSQAHSLTHSLIKIQAFSLAVAGMLHSYCIGWRNPYCNRKFLKILNSSSFTTVTWGFLPRLIGIWPCFTFVYSTQHGVRWRDFSALIWWPHVRLMEWIRPVKKSYLLNLLISPENIALSRSVKNNSLFC